MNMQIAGIQRLTLVDFPGHVAATVFTRGCSFRCPFCHNPELVVPEKFNPLLSEKQILNFLESRFGKLNGICVTGGEPCMQSDIDKFITYLKALGYDVKLDTNGSYPDKLAKIIKDGDVDYIAMDIKSSLAKYAMTTQVKSQKSPVSPGASRGGKVKSDCHSGLACLPVGMDPESSSICHSEQSEESLLKNIKKSINLIMSSGIDYEFRTTVCHPLHEIKDFKEIGEMIKGAKRYFIQNYQHSKQVDEKSEFQPFSDTELEAAKKIMQVYTNEVTIR